MSARFVLSAAVGVGVGLLAGPVAGAQAFSIGYAVTGFLDPRQKVQGPRLDDLRAPSAAYGAVIPYVEGHPRVPGLIAWCTDKREIAMTTTSGGKGGPGVDSTNYTYEVDCMFILAENPGFGVRRIWSNGALIWTAADESDDASIEASTETISWRTMTVYDGADDQLPDPTYEADVGIGNAPAFRGRSTVVFEGMNLGPSGQFPLLTFEIYDSAVVTTTGFLEDFETSYPDEWTITGGSAFALEAGPWGDCMTVAGGYITAFGSSIIRAVDTGGPITKVNFKFRMDEPFVLGDNTDDAPVLELLDAGNARLFAFWGAREWFYDVHQAPAVAFGVASEVLLTSSPLPTGVWFDCTLEITALNTCQVTIVNLNTGAQVVTQSCSMSGSSWTPGFLKIFDSWSYGGSNSKPGCSFDQIYLGVPATRVALIEPTLEDVMTRQWQRAGLDAALLDASAGAAVYVRAMAVTQVTSPRQVMDMLATAYLMEFVESGAGVRMVARGGAPVATIPWDDLGAAAGDAAADEPLPLVRGNELETPAQWSVKFANVDNDYQDGNESSPRYATGSSIAAITELPIGLTPTEAKRRADIYVTDAIASLVRVGPIALTREHAALEPTDVVLIAASSGSTWRTRLLRKTEADGLLTFEGVLDDATAVVSDAVTSGGYHSSVVVRSVAATLLELLDIPILRDADNARGIYAAGKPDGTPWSGFALYKSPDGTTYASVGSIGSAAVFGTCSVVPGDWLGGARLFDERSAIVVDVGDGTLASATREAILADDATNAFAIGVDGRWLIGQFRDAELVGAGTYRLTGLLLGGRGTEHQIGTQEAGDTFVALDAALLRAAQETLDQDALRYYKPVSAGKSVASSASQTFTGHGVGLKPFAPVDLRATRDSGDITLTWQRRTRLQVRAIGPAGVLVPLGEESEAYSVDVLADDSDGAVLRTLTSSTPTVEYTAAQQTTDFGSPQASVSFAVHQLSSAVGRGFPAEATL